MHTTRAVDAYGTRVLPVSEARGCYLLGRIRVELIYDRMVCCSVGD